MRSRTVLIACSIVTVVGCTTDPTGLPVLGAQPGQGSSPLAGAGGSGALGAAGASGSSGAEGPGSGSPTGSAPPVAADAGAPPPLDATAVEDARMPDLRPAAPPRTCGATRSAPGLTIYPRQGSGNDSASAPLGPGLVLMGGGTDVRQAFLWAADTLAGTGQRAGDVIVLRASGADGYDDYIDDMNRFNSVRTILIADNASAEALAAAATHVDCAEFVFFAGGDQGDYVRWQNTPLMEAVQAVWSRGGVVGGTSAGLAILGQFVYDALAGSATSAQALGNPFHATISFTRDMLRFTPLDNAITDSHFGARDRFGRLTAFMARLIADGAVTNNPPRVLGIGVDEATALVIDKNGIGRRVGAGTAYLLRGGPAGRVSRGQTLDYAGITVTRLSTDSHSFDFGKWCGTGPTYSTSIANGRYSGDPYDTNGQPGACP